MKTGNTTLINIHLRTSTRRTLPIYRAIQQRRRPVLIEMANPFKDGTREEVIEKYREHRTSA